MNIRKFYSLDNNIYTVTLKTEDWSENDKQLMQDFGEPQIDLGGSFTTPTFTLPSRLASIMSDSPFIQAFDFRDYADAEDRADRWATTISSRLVSSVTALRGLSDTFTREAIQQV